MVKNKTTGYKVINYKSLQKVNDHLLQVVVGFKKFICRKLNRLLHLLHKGGIKIQIPSTSTNDTPLSHQY